MELTNDPHLNHFSHIAQDELQIAEYQHELEIGIQWGEFSLILFLVRLTISLCNV